MKTFKYFALFSICLFYFNTTIFAQNDAKKPFTAVIGAMQVEVDLFKTKVSPKRDTVIMGITFTIGKIRSRDVVVVKSGIGKVNAV